MTPTDTHCINTPTFARSAVIAGHPPPEFSARNYLKRRYVHDSRHETPRVSAPCLTTRNGTAAIGGDRAVVAACEERAADRKNILKRVSTIGADFQHAPIEADIWINIRGFKIEVVPEFQLNGGTFKKRDRQGIQSFVAYFRWIIDEPGIGLCIRRWARLAAV